MNLLYKLLLIVTVIVITNIGPISATNLPVGSSPSSPGYQTLPDATQTSFSCAAACSATTQGGAIDTTGYSMIGVWFTGIGSSNTIVFQYSDDNSNWANLTCQRDSDGLPLTTVLGTGAHSCNLSHRYFRINTTAYGSGTISGLITEKAIGKTPYPAVGMYPIPVGGASAYGITPGSSSAAEGNHVLKASAGNLYALYVTTGATAGFLLTFNLTTDPVDGAVTPVECIPVPANSTTALDFGNGPTDFYGTGITAAFSTTGCFTKTESATAFFKWRVK